MSRSKRSNLVFGRQPVLELFQQGTPVEKIFLQRGATGDAVVQLRELARRFRVPLQGVPREALARMTSGHHQGVVAYTAEVQYQLLEDLLPFLYEQGEVPFLVLLDGVTDVRNFGAIARTALASGAHGLVVGLRDAAPANAEAIKASAGALLQLPVCRETSLPAAIRDLQQHGLRILGLSANAPVLSWSEDLKIPIALVAGAEGSGMQDDVQELLDGSIALPMHGSFDSYNVSVAVGMVCYEVMRQRGS